MALLQLRPYFDPIMRTVSAPVRLDLDNRPPADVMKLAMSMVETSRAINGAGMAAVQVGVPIRLFILDLAHHGGDSITFINPEIVEAAPELALRKEGCLSMPDCFIELERPEWVKVAYTNVQGERAIYDATGLASMCVQHEIDHLDGIRNIDRLSKLKRDRVIKSYQKHKPYLRRPASGPGTATASTTMGPTAGMSTNL